MTLIAERNPSNWTTKPYIPSTKKINSDVSQYFQSRRDKKQIKILDIEIPEELVMLRDVIEKSKYMLEFTDNWDENGSKSYSEDTWEKSARFVINLMINYWKKNFIKPIEPSIYHAPESSIDIFWKIKKFTLLINIPKDINQKATFYGKNELNGNEIKGSFDTSKPVDWLICWME